jgi:hypothetical protein
MQPADDGARPGGRRQDADIRLRGFTDRVSLPEAVAWIDRRRFIALLQHPSTRELLAELGFKT